MSRLDTIARTARRILRISNLYVTVSTHTILYAGAQTVLLAGLPSRRVNTETESNPVLKVKRNVNWGPLSFIFIRYTYSVYCIQSIPWTLRFLTVCPAPQGGAAFATHDT